MDMRMPGPGIRQHWNWIHNDCKEGCGDAAGDDSEGNYSNRGNSDNQRSDIPELLFCVSGEREVPTCTMNETRPNDADQWYLFYGKEKSGSICRIRT